MKINKDKIEPSELCRFALKLYEENIDKSKTELLRINLKNAYEGVLEDHRKTILGDMDIGDGPIRDIVYGEHNLSNWDYHNYINFYGELYLPHFLDYPKYIIKLATGSGSNLPPYLITPKDLETIFTSIHNIFYLVENTCDEISQKHKNELINIGDELATASFLITKHQMPQITKQVTDEIVEIHKKVKNEKLIEYLKNGDVNFFFGMCRYCGQEIAAGTPDNIDKMLKSVVLIKP
jgi:hypothetical protein